MKLMDLGVNSAYLVIIFSIRNVKWISNGVHNTESICVLNAKITLYWLAICVVMMNALKNY